MCATVPHFTEKIKFSNKGGENDLSVILFPEKKYNIARLCCQVMQYYRRIVSIFWIILYLRKAHNPKYIRKGQLYGYNGAIENFFGWLKVEMFYWGTFEMVGEFIHA